VFSGTIQQTVAIVQLGTENTVSNRNRGIISQKWPDMFGLNNNNIPGFTTHYKQENKEEHGVPYGLPVHRDKVIIARAISSVSQIIIGGY